MDQEKAGVRKTSDDSSDMEDIESLEALTTHEDTVNPSSVTQLAKKQRDKRFFSNFLCCVGQSASNADPAVPLQTQLTSSHSPPKPSEKLLLPPVRPCDINKKCLIVDLDETLVHSSFKPVNNPDFIIPVEIDGVVHQVYVLRRPHVDKFLHKIGSLYECILFTASLAKYADPVADLLDKTGVFKDLNRLGRDLKRVIIVDNSPASYAFHPDNASLLSYKDYSKRNQLVPVQSWFDDMNDTELLDVLPFLEKLSTADSVYNVLRNPNAFSRSASLLEASRLSPLSPAVINITNNININIINNNNLDNGSDRKTGNIHRMTRNMEEDESQVTTNRLNGVVCFTSVATNKSRLINIETTPFASHQRPLHIENVIMSVDRTTSLIHR